MKKIYFLCYQNITWSTRHLGNETEFGVSSEGSFAVICYLIWLLFAISFTKLFFSLISSSCGSLHSISQGQTRVFYCDPPLLGRYITINVLETNKELAICEIAVYDSELTSEFILNP